MTNGPKNKTESAATQPKIKVEPMTTPPQRPDPQIVPQTVRGNFPPRQDRELSRNGSNGTHKK